MGIAQNVGLKKGVKRMLNITGSITEKNGQEKIKSLINSLNKKICLQKKVI